jgi:hypothetical protein
MSPLPNCEPTRALPPVLADVEVAQGIERSRLFFDVTRGGWVYERGPARLNVVMFQPRRKRVEVLDPEPRV